MNAATVLLDRLAEIGATIRPEGDSLVVRAGAKPIPAELVRGLRETKAVLLAALTFSEHEADQEDSDPIEAQARWRALYSERIAHWSGTNRDWSGAKRLAYGELLDEWRKLHGRKWPTWQCAGCGMPIGARSALTLCDDNRVHFGDKLDCLTRYGRRWRGDAMTAIRSVGILPEPDWEN